MTKNKLLLFTMVVSLMAIGAGCTGNNQNNSDFDVPSFITSDYNDDEGNDSTAVSNNGMVDGKAVSVVVKPGVTTVKTNTGTTSTETKDYGTALNIYGKSGYRFQFSQCSGSPGSLIMKLGTKFMIDNRDDKSHQIGIGTQSYKLAAYDFAIISIKKIGSYNITCDGGGAARVDVRS